MTVAADSLPVSLMPANDPTEPETLVVEPAPPVSLIPLSHEASSPEPVDELPHLFPTDVEPDLPDLFTTDVFAGPTGTGPNASRSGGFLPPPPLVSADAPDLPMSATNGGRATAPTAPGIGPTPEASSKRRLGGRGRRRESAEVGNAPVGTEVSQVSVDVANDTDAAPAPKAARRRPSWLLPAVLAAAVVAGGAVLLNSQKQDSSSAPPITTVRRVVTPTTNPAATTSASAPATTSASTTPAATIAPTAATTSATTPATSASATTVATTVATTPATPATTVGPASTVATTAAPQVPADFPPPSIVTGTGNRTFKISLAQQSTVILEATHKGTRNFIVKALDAKGGTLTVPINQVGAFAGSVVLDPAASLQVTADGAWSVTIKPLLSARQIIGATPTSGKGSEVVLYSGPATKAAVSHNGQRTFSIDLRTKGAPSATIVNEVGSYQGSVDLPEGISVLAIVADGNWTLNPR